MVERPFLRSVGSRAGTQLPSSLFQQLSADYPSLSRRVVGEVLTRVAGTAHGPLPDSGQLLEMESAARGLLDAMRTRAEEALHRTRGVVPDRHPPDGVVRDAREAFSSRGRIPADRLADVMRDRTESVDFASRAQLICESAAEELRVAAVAISVPGDLLSAETVGASGAVGRALEGLQVVLGEGPSPDALRYGDAVLVEDLTAPHHQTRWPLYAAQAVERGVHGQFVLPLQVGAARFGVLAVYAEPTGALPAPVLEATRVFAEVALGVLLDRETGSGPAGVVGFRERLPHLDDRSEIHQATGMVSVQLGVGLGTAMLRMRARAFADELPLSTLARAVVARTVRFERDTDNRGPHWSANCS